MGWEGVRKEPEKLPVCPQLGGAAGREAFNGHVNELTEDCLVLNVWTPTLDRAAKLPVIFYIHGGAGKMGTAMSPRLGGTHGSLMQSEIMVGKLTKGLSRNTLTRG